MWIEEEQTNEPFRNLDSIKCKFRDETDEPFYVSLSDLSESDRRNILANCTDEQLVQVIVELRNSYQTVISALTGEIAVSNDRTTLYLYADKLAESMKQFGNTFDVVLPDTAYTPENEKEELTDEVENNVP